MATMEDAAAALVLCLRESFVDPDTGEPEIVLARSFQTAALDALTPELRQYAAERLAGTPAPTLRCLALLGTDGDLPAWCDRRTSEAHRAIPLPSVDALAAIPMVSALVQHFGVREDVIVHGGQPADDAPADADFEVFFVPEAAGNAHVPDQDFVRSHGVRSVLGFGGLLPGGDMFAVILFTRAPISAEVSGLFRTVAVAVRLSLLPALTSPLFHGQDNRPADPLAVATSRVRALEQMLDVQQETVITQAARLQGAVSDAVAARTQAEDAALELQRSLLPQSLVAPDGLEIGYEYVAGGGGTDVGGDWFDVISLTGGRTAFVIGDVMGKGVRAAAIMGQLRTAIRAYSVSDLPAGTLMSRLNQLVSDMPEDVIATCTYAVHDQIEDTLTLASAGHLPTAFVSADAEVSLDGLALGPPLGVVGAAYDQQRLEFPVGARMLLYTDGLVEHRERSIDAGLRSLESRLRELYDEPPDRICAELIASMVDADTHDDDVALLMVCNVGVDRRDHVERRFSPDPAEAASVRALVRSVLHTWGDQELSDPVVAVVNELFVNAVQHARTEVTVRLRRLPTVLIAEVADLARHMPRLSHADATDEPHRGMQIVQSLSTRWEARPTESGKVVCAEFSTADVTSPGPGPSH